MSDTTQYAQHIALVTGGSRGIGKAIVKELIKRGYEVFYFSRTKGEETAHAHHIEVDMSNPESVDNGMKQFFALTPRVDVVVNNAGITRDNLIMRLSVQAWDEVMNVNLRAAFLVCKSVSRVMAKQRSGSIINISSVVGISGNGGQTNYSASKAGLIGFSKSLAKELSSRNVRVNVVAPGFIETDMSDAIPSSMKEEIVANIPLKRIGNVDEIAAVVAFFASNEASYITGQVLCVDGGMVM
jgi:3-oxoacyl-[acyl-carrier protein] reductase